MIFWVVWVFFVGIFIEEEDVDFYWSFVEFLYMCRYSFCKDDIFVLGLVDLKSGDFRGMLDFVYYFIGIMWRFVFLIYYYVYILVIYLKCIL